MNALHTLLGWIGRWFSAVLATIFAYAKWVEAVARSGADALVLLLAIPALLFWVQVAVAPQWLSALLGIALALPCVALILAATFWMIASLGRDR